mmetsp:Transcript_47847/g.95138  ORF Transcript_47847/g.95138 Transcript_47847/m.95138 type:complete len:369 (-) Transcript_47847:137-1243(-)
MAFPAARPLKDPMPFQATSTSASWKPASAFCRMPSKSAATPAPPRKFRRNDNRVRTVWPAQRFPSSVPSRRVLLFMSSLNNALQHRRPRASILAGSSEMPLPERSTTRRKQRSFRMRSLSTREPSIESLFREMSMTSTVSRIAVTKSIMPTSVRRLSRNLQRVIWSVLRRFLSLSRAFSCKSPRPEAVMSSSVPWNPLCTVRANFGSMPLPSQSSPYLSVTPLFEDLADTGNRGSGCSGLRRQALPGLLRFLGTGVDLEGLVGESGVFGQCCSDSVEALLSMFARSASCRSATALSKLSLRRGSGVALGTTASEDRSVRCSPAMVPPAAARCPRHRMKLLMLVGGESHSDLIVCGAGAETSPDSRNCH